MLVQRQPAAARPILPRDEAGQRIRHAEPHVGHSYLHLECVRGAKHSYGTPTPSPDYENTRCILLWGANPRATYPTAAQRTRARARGAKLIVIDPRRTNLARSADSWLRVRPGSDAALALAMIHVLIEEKLFDEAFIRDWTTGPFLVRDNLNLYFQLAT